MKISHRDARLDPARLPGLRLVFLTHTLAPLTPHEGGGLRDQRWLSASLRELLWLVERDCLDRFSRLGCHSVKSDRWRLGRSFSLWNQ